MATIKGKWRWNDDVDTLPDSIYDLTADVHFSSNGEEFSKLKVEKFAIPSHVVIYYKTIYDTIMVQRCLMNDPDDENDDEDFEIEEFLNETYRVMDFGETEQEISDELYAFILANATEYSPIAEKLVEVANNVQKVFEAGKQQGHDEGYDSGYNEGFEAGKEYGGYNEGFDEGKKVGKQEEYDTFWDAIQQNGSRTDYSRAFMYWGSDYIRPKHKVVPTALGGAYNIIYRCPNLKKIEAEYFDFSQLPYGTKDGESHAYAFGLCPLLEEVEDVGLYPAFSYAYAFISCFALRKVACIRVDKDTSLKSIFSGCSALEEVTFDGEIGQNLDLRRSTKLSKDSITNIITHLSDSATEKTLTLSKAAVDKAFETSEGANDGTSSQEWDSLEGLKTNWEITLV